MRVFVPQPVHPGFFSQMSLVLPQAEWWLEGSEFVWGADLARCHPIGSVRFCGKSLSDVDLGSFDMVLAVVETHYLGGSEFALDADRQKLASHGGPIVWRNYFTPMSDEMAINGPVVYSAQCVRDVSSLDGPVIREVRDPSIFSGWRGDDTRALAVALDIGSSDGRFLACGGPMLRSLASKIPLRALTSRDPIPFPDLVEAYRASRCYVETAPDMRLRTAPDMCSLSTSDMRSLTGARVFSGSFIEAMLTGCPVVTTDVNEFALLVEHGRTGFCCADEDDVVAAVLALAEDRRLAAEIGAAGREFALSEFSVARAAAAWEEVVRRAGVDVALLDRSTGGGEPT